MINKQACYLYSKIISILKTKTIAHSAITFSGTVINGLLGIIFYIVLARNLGPANFGLISVAIASLTMVADIAGLGTDTGLIRFIGKYVSQDKNNALRFMKLALKVKLAVWFAILLFGWFFAPVIAKDIFLKEELIFPLRLAMVGVGASLLFSFVSHSLQAFQRYLSWSLINIGVNGLRLVLLLGLIILASLDLNSALLTYITMPFLGFTIGLFILPKFWNVIGENLVAKEFFNYNKWVALSTLLAAIGARLDVFLSARLVSADQLGIYSAANQLTMIVPQLVFALATVVAPKLAGFRNNQEAIAYLKKLQLLVLALALVAIFAIPLASWAIPLFYGSDYQSSIVLFSILLFAQLFFLISLPAHQAVFYYFAKPSLFVWVTLGHILIMGFLGWNLIYNFGVIGAAWAVLIGSVFNFIVPTSWVIYQFRKK